MSFPYPPLYYTRGGAFNSRGVQWHLRTDVSGGPNNPIGVSRIIGFRPALNPRRKKGGPTP